MDIPRTTFSQWVWPVAMIFDNPPVVSDGYGRNKRLGTDGKFKGHFGVDIMHPRRSGDARDIGVVVTKNFMTYPNEEVCLAADGLIRETGQSSTGHFVRAEHRVGGRSILSVYRHLQNVRPEIQKGVAIRGGFSLGLMGDDPNNQADPIHLHFELWDLGRTRFYPETTFDPALVMEHWRVKRLPQDDIVPYPGKPPKPSGGGGEGISAAVLSTLGGLFITVLAYRRTRMRGWI